MGEKGRPWGLPFWFGGSRERLCRIGRWSGFGPAQVQTCEVGSRPVPGGGSRLSLEKARTQRVAGEGPRPPFFLWPARSHSLVLAWWGAAGRSLGYFRAQVRALIWIRILREQGLGERVFRGGGIPPTKASPRGEGFGVGKPSFRVSDTCRPTDSPGRAHPAGPGGSPQKPIGSYAPNRPTDSPGRAYPAGPGGSPQKDPKGPTNLSAQRTRPVGHASQSSAGRSRRKRIKSCFDRLRRPKHTSQPPVCPQGARSGCIPQFWEGLHTKQNIRHPRTLPSRTKLSPRLPLPKFPS